jgi:hypothetical protein
LPFFCKNGIFLKNQCYDQIFEKTSSSLSEKTPIFSLILSAKIPTIKIVTSVPSLWYVVPKYLATTAATTYLRVSFELVSQPLEITVAAPDARFLDAKNRQIRLKKRI